MKLTTRNLVRLEKKLGKNPLSIFTGMDNGELPKLEDLLTIYQYMLMDIDEKKYSDINEVYADYDKFLENGDMMKFINDILIEGFVESGIIPKNALMEK